MSDARKPTVHILMATCQGEAFLEQQLKSIEDQSYDQWVLHVSDDGSSDRTWSILEAFKARMEKIGSQKPIQSSSKNDLQNCSLDAFTEGLVPAEQKDTEQAQQDLKLSAKPMQNHEKPDANTSGLRAYLYKGPKRGSTVNFMHLVHLIAGAGRLSSEDLVAFADQDDVWLPSKLERAVVWHLNARGQDQTLNERAVLYAAKTYLVDEGLRILGESKTPKVPLSFNAALVENVLSGNTMVMNKALIDILKRMQVTHSVWHDWSAYLVATACSGHLHYDERPCVYYRQHEKNVIGVKRGLGQQLSRIQWVFKGRFKSWMQTNMMGLGDIEDAMASGPRDLKRSLESLRQERSAVGRLFKVWQLSLRRQNPFVQMVLYVGLVLGVL